MNLRIKVNANRKVTDPETGKELAPGTVYLVQDSIFWRRRLQSADVAEVKDPPKAEPIDKSASENPTETTTEQSPKPESPKRESVKPEKKFNKHK
ncbi:MAG: DUF2635 domain-containing protein [Planctomycetota bacterium]|jgi:hypothetical protein|nr:DUF2635 domain-containing protein [Planctomycetota bacterium]